jgi:hypothetical protein
MPETQLAVPEERTEAMTLQGVKRQINLIQQVMKSEMRDGEHFGKIPGCGDKPALLKAGAEKLALTFRLAPKFEIVLENMPGGHREYRIITSIYHIDSGKFLGAGMGSGSTMESKYRYRSGEGEDTGKIVPKDYWDARKMDPKKAQSLIGGPGFSTRKIDGVWKICSKGEKAENPDIADTYNTVLKMAKKRSLIDAILTVTAASDIFTQDIEEFVDEVPAPAAPKAADKPSGSDRLLSEAEIKLLHAKITDWAKATGESDAEMKAVVKTYCKEHLGKETSKDLTVSELSDLLKWMKAQQEPPAAAE